MGVGPSGNQQKDGALYVCRALANGEEHRVERITDSARLATAMHASGDYPQGLAATRLATGRDAFGLVVDGLVVSYGWAALTDEPIGDLGFSFRLAPGSSYIYDCATHPTFRGRGYYPVLLKGMLAHLATEGCNEAWIGTAPANYVSQRGIVRAGFVKVADVRINPRAENLTVDVFGVPGIPLDVLNRAAWAFHGTAHVDAGIPTD